MVPRITHILVAAAFAFVPAALWAQSSAMGTIAGSVKDTTGAVLPGVTVEASSPALIEKVRSVVTDDQGNYKIVDLRPGTYTVRFALPGFSLFKREGLELSTGVTAAVNAEMRVGALEETVTVTGASPVVDVQNVRKQAVFTNEVIDTLPTGKTIQGFTALTLGAKGSGTVGGVQDVGGSKGERNAGFGVHGTRANDAKLLQEGMYYSTPNGNGSLASRNNQINQAAVQEIVIQTSGMSAEAETGGPQLNVVLKDGSNRVAFYASGTGAGPALQGENVTDALRARGVATPPSIKRIYDVGVGVGGPLKRDKLWFYTAHRYWGNQEYVPGNYFNKTHGTFVYTPDLSRPAYDSGETQDNSIRFSWQVSARNKIIGNYSRQFNCKCFNSVDNTPPRAPEATTRGQTWPKITQIVWNHPTTNRLLFEAGLTYLYDTKTQARQDGVTTETVPVQELSTGRQFNALGDSLTGRVYSEVGGVYFDNQSNQRFAVTYVTGSHAFKTGATVYEAWDRNPFSMNEVPGVGPVYYQLRLGAPAAIVQYASPRLILNRVIPNLGMFAQDQWTVRKLTLNLGVRFDYFHGYAPAGRSPAGTFVPSYEFAKKNNIPNWKDAAPRLGIAYDVFGNGKTAFKASLGRYVQLETNTTIAANNPPNTIVASATRTWADANGDFFPNCDLKVITANGECGALNNRLFGTPVVSTTYDPGTLRGFGVRPNSWQATAGVQQELRPGVALNAGYYRTWFGNFTVVDNRSVTSADFDPFCITAPTDSRLGDVSGTRLCDLFDVNPARFGQVDNLITLASNFGGQTEVYNGFEAAINARFGRGGLLQGGMSSGRTVIDTCAVVDSPQAARAGYCRSVLPFEGQTQYKLSGIYPLPWDLQMSAVLQNLPGIPIAANQVIPNAQIAPSLGRNLAAGANATATIALLPANVLYEDRLTQFDLRFTRIVRLGRARVHGNFDIYNLFNGSAVLAVNTTYGPDWLRPSGILGARLFKFSAQVDF